MLSAFIDGLNRVKRAPWLVIGVWLSTLLLALPLTLVLHEQIAAHLGSSMAAQAAADGVNYDWWNEFLAQTSGVGASFVPAILGFAAVMKNLSTVADTSAMPTIIAATVVIYLLVSMFLAGGVIDRLARDHDLGAGAFFSACGVYFVRFIRLGVITAMVYWVLFGPYHAWLFGAGVSGADGEHHGGAHRVLHPSGPLRRVRGAALRVQHPLRLRKDSRGRRGSPQHDRRDRGRLAVHSPASDRGGGRSTRSTRSCSCW